jgi:hypothetical protein
MQDACLPSQMLPARKDWSSNMADNNNQPKVINKSGTLKMTDETAATRKSRDIGGRPFDRRNNRRRGGVRADVAPKEYDEVTINIDRVSRTVAGGRRMRFKALVAIGNHKNKIGVGVAKGNDVTIENGKVSVTVTDPTAAYARLFFWDSLNNIRPISGDIVVRK